MSGTRDDLSRYSRSNYHARNVDSDDAAQVPHERREDSEWVAPENRQAAGAPGRRVRPGGAQSTASAFSRGNAAERYRHMERHASNGEASLAERLREQRMAGGARASKAPLVRRVLIAVLVLLVAALVVWYVMVSQAMRPSEDVSGSVTAPGFGQPYYVLLLGSDSRSEDGSVSRADSIMLCRVDEGAKKVTMISLPRDLRVEIEGHGYGKLNAALAHNGISGIVDAASDLAGVPISYYACIYFSGFEGLVDDLGGVTVEVPEGTYYKGVTVPAGDAVKINGKEALVLARCRHGNPPDQGAYARGDYQRTENQRNLMKAIVKKIMKQPFFMVPGQVYTVSKCVETNMPAWKMAQLALAMRGMDADEMYSASAPAYGEYIGGVSYQILDDSAWDAMMRRVEAGQDPNG